MLHQVLDNQVGLEIAGDPGMQVRKGAAAVVLLGGENIAELGLAARPLEENHERLRDLHGDVMAVILFDHGKRKIDSRRHAGGGPHLSIAGKKRIALDPDIRISVLQFLDTSPVGGDRLPGEQSRLRREKCPHTGRGNAAARLMARGDPPRQRLLFKRVEYPEATGHDQGIDGACRGLAQG